MQITGVKMQGNMGKGYGLSLNDGSSWWITGNKDNARWVDRLATVMELQECAWNGSPKLIFSKMQDANGARDGASDSPLRRLGWWETDEGWICYDHKTIRAWYHNSISDVVFEIDNNDGNYTIECINMWYSCQAIYKPSIRRGGLPLHAGLVELDGRGVLLVAPGGTGKSTCCRRIPNYWKSLCDDEMLAILDEAGNYRAHPFPTWSDYLLKRAKMWNVQYSVPISAVFFLKQSENDEAVPVGKGEAAVLMSESARQVCYDLEGREGRKGQSKLGIELFNNACEMAKMIPTFRLRISLHGKFWEEIEKALEW